MSRVILLGATGHTGALTLRQLAAHSPDCELILLGRNVDALNEAATSAGSQATAGHANISNPGELDDLLKPGDVLVSTVGPFTTLGRNVAVSAAHAGVTYLDTTGEPPFIDWMFRCLGDLAADHDSLMVPAFGYDFVPGHLAAARVLEAAGRRAAGVQIGYFLAPGSPGTPGRRDIPTLRQFVGMTTGGTHASLARVTCEPSFQYRGQSRDDFGHEPCRSAGGLLRFSVDGVDRAAVTIGGSEHFGLPEMFPHLQRVDVGLGWFGNATKPVFRSASAMGPVIGSEVIRRTAARLVDRIPWTCRPPSQPARSVVVATACDAAGAPIETYALEGPEPYALTAGLLTWAVLRCLDSWPSAAGVHGPLLAFGGTGAVADACRYAGATSFAP
jgi:hypothetical protein